MDFIQRIGWYIKNVCRFISYLLRAFKDDFILNINYENKC